MHFGVYSILGRGEWVQWNEQIPVGEYAKLADRFDPEHFDAGAWAQVARDAGMRYTVLTSRHHDGFALFDDPESNFTSVRSAFKRDVVAEYVKAVRGAGLRVGLYYSPLDWRYPGFFFPDLYRDSANAMRDQYHRQMQELLTKYGRLDVLWFDGGGADWLGFHGVTFGGPNGWHARPKGVPYTGGFSWGDDEVYAMIRRLQPDAISNGRIDAPEDFHSREGDASLGDFDNAKPWELCTTLAGAWGYQANAKVKPLDRCIQLLVGAVGRDGNLLLNVGPRPDGVIDPPQVARLKEIGDWLKANGESIYGTRGGPFLPGAFGVSTYRGRTIYVHVLHPPAPTAGDAAGVTLTLPPIPAKVLRCRQLGGNPASCAQADAGLTITFTPDPARLDAIVALELDRDVAGIAPVSTTRPSK
jgi:alpha-L-fucosidase